jgi:isoleucyl-tRNA synthetase
MDTPSLDLKKTLNLPRTDFPMKAGLPQNEPKLLARWKQENLYERIRGVRAGRPLYVLHDGPPYANGNIHLGHALNKLLKDFVIKSRSMSGFDTPYVPGWDCHGLPIEIKVDGELGSKKAQMTTVQIRQACRAYAQKYVNLQNQDFQRLGIFGRWEDPYLTMAAPYQATIARSFVDFLDQGYVYKGLKPVNWCMNCRTTLAEAEVEYENKTSPSIYVRFALKSDPAKIDAALAGKKVYGLIWTTTPWTIPANVAISFHPTFTYAAVEVGDAVYIVADGLLATVRETLGWSEASVIAQFPGKVLDRSVYQHPMIERESLGLLGDHVTLEAGTGAVHTAPGHGLEDFMVCQQYGIPVYCPVDGAGRYFAAPGAAGELPIELLGRTVWEANPMVTAMLSEAGALLLEKKYEHTYPHCWRCHKPTIFRGTPQWFISMEANQLRQRALEAIKQVKWTPAWGEERISNMIATRPDWVISRQRTWGVPITVFYCDDCNETITERRLLDKVLARFEKESADAWYALTPEELTGEKIECKKCGSLKIRKETDILDVWFDSGASHMAVLNEANGLPWPSDMYLEGGDQYRGWFHSSLLIGTALRGAAPYRGCATNGWTLDEHGRAMSKSLGNVIEPAKIINEHGAEILRLWVGSIEFQEDVRLSKTILDRLVDAYRKMRNTFRYALGNLDSFDPALHSVPTSEMEEIDQWILGEAEKLVARCRVHYDALEFIRVYQAFYNFTGTELSSIYFDVLKDRLYTSGPDSKARRSAQTALHRLTHCLTRLIAPILAFTSEEVWSYLAKQPGDLDSVHMMLFPEAGELTAGMTEAQRQRLQNWPRLLAVREQVLPELESAREAKLIGAPTQAQVTLQAGPDLFPLLWEYRELLPSLFITSMVNVEQRSAEGVSASVARADGVRCERCWKFTLNVGDSADFPTVCAPCAEVLQASWVSKA